MINRKERAFQEHKELIGCLWYVGRGVMFRKHLIQYFTLLGHRQKSVEVAIRDLIDSDLIEVIRYGNSHFLKLKKYGIYSLLKKESNEVGSIRITQTRIWRSAFLNARTLEQLANQHGTLEKGFAAVLKWSKLSRTHSAFEKKAYVVLEFLWSADEKNKKRNSERAHTKYFRYLSDYALDEIEDLRILDKYANEGKYSDEARVIRMKKASQQQLTKDVMINLNGMQSRDIYFSLSKDKGVLVLNLDFLDLDSSMKQKKLEDRMKRALVYVDHVFDSAVSVRVNVLVSSKIREEYFKARLKMIVENVSSSTNLRDYTIDVIDLNLEETLFAMMMPIA